jgi:hypothetical protein
VGDNVTIESKNALLNEPTLPAEPEPLTLTPDERWARWREKGESESAHSARMMRLIASMLALGLMIGFIWAYLSPR